MKQKALEHEDPKNSPPDNGSARPDERPPNQSLQQSNSICQQLVSLWNSIPQLYEYQWDFLIQFFIERFSFELKVGYIHAEHNSSSFF